MNIGKLIAAPIALLFGLFLAMQIFAESGNIFGNVAFYLGIGAFIIGMLKPKAGMFMMIVGLGYVDLLKRMLTLDSRFALTDTASILAIPLAMMLGICTGLGALSLMGRLKIPSLPFIYGNALTLFVGTASVIRAGLGFGGIAAAANAGAYCVLIWVVPTLFQTREEVWKYCRWILIVFFPVGVVGIKQLFWGYSDFVEAYLWSGYTIEIKQLLWDGIRPFSTMASPGNFSGMMSTCAILVLFVYVTKKDIKGKRGNTLFMVVLFLFFIFAGFCSMKRMPMSIWIFALGGMVVLRSWWTVSFTYLAMIGIFVFIGLNYNMAYDILANLNEDVHVGGDIGDKMSKLKTFNARLESIALLFEAEQYSWFGIPDEELSTRAYGAHGLLLTIVTRVGAVPLALAGLIAGFYSFRIHATLIRLKRNSAQFRSGLILASLTFSFVAVTILGGLVLDSFPMNFVVILFLTLTLMEAGIMDAGWAQKSLPTKESLDKEKRLGEGGLRRGDLPIAGPGGAGGIAR